MNKITITIEQIKLNPNLDLSERIKLYSKEGKWNKDDLEELAVASIKQEYEYWANNRTNISERTDNMLQSILNGHKLDKIETFEMMCDDTLKVQEYAKYEMLKRNISDNNGISVKDFEKLCSVIGLDLKTANIIKEELEMRGLIIEEYKESNRHK